MLQASAASGTAQTGIRVSGLGTLQQGATEAPTSMWSRRWST